MNWKRILGFCMVSVIMGFASLSWAQVGEGDIENREKTLSPFFFVDSDDPGLDPMPLKSTEVDVSIAGVMAKVKITQIYENEGERPIEARYVFPMSVNAAVNGMRMTIGERVIEAEIKEREQAREDFEEAREEGKTASLLEQERPNVFQMDVTNILPGDTIEVETEYVELIVPEDGTYEYVFPTVVGPRYSETPSDDAPDEDEFVENPYLREGLDSPFNYNIHTTLNSGIPLQSIESPSHDIEVEQETEAQAQISLATTEGAGTKDYILRYNLQGNQIETGSLLYEGEEENFFLVMMEPPNRVEEEEIPARRYMYILDVSGSMRGFPLNTSKAFMQDLLQRLRPKDSFNILAFAGGSRILFKEPVAATSDNIQEAINRIDQLSGGGGTQLLNALQNAFDRVEQFETDSNSAVVVTDGYVSFEVEAFELIRSRLNDANLFSVGIGSSPNRFLIEGMARAGLGEQLIVTNQEEAEEQVPKFNRYIQEPVLTNIDVQIDGLQTHDVEPPAIPDLFAQRPIIVYGKYTGDPQGNVTIQGNTGAGDFSKTIDITPESVDAGNEALRYLWARKRIQTLVDYNNVQEDDERVDEVTQLGLTYNLVTPYTSFIAVDSEVRNATGDPEQVKQPLPLPEGVPETALPSRGGSAGDAVSVNNWQRHGSVGAMGMPSSYFRSASRKQSSQPPGNNVVSATNANENQSPTNQGDYFVRRVVDSQTVEVVHNGNRIQVTLAGIRVAESENIRQNVLDYLNNELLGSYLDVEFVELDVNDGNRYAMLILNGERNVSQELLQKGWAELNEQTCPPDYREEFRQTPVEQ